MKKPLLRHISFPPLLQFPGSSGGNAQWLYEGSTFDAQQFPWRVLLAGGGIIAFGHSGRDSSSIGFLPVHLPDGALPAYVRISGRTGVPLEVSFVRQRLTHPEDGVFSSPPQVRHLAGKTISPDDPTGWVIEVAPGWIIPGEAEVQGGWQAEAVIDNARFWYGILLQTQTSGESDSADGVELTGLTIGYYEGFDSA